MIARYAVVLMSACLIGCHTAADGERLVVPTNLRNGLRAAALGCWRITADSTQVGQPSSSSFPLHVRLDSSLSRGMSESSHRVAWRLDTLGRRMVKDGEGFDVLDFWAAESQSDRVLLVTANGLYGVTLVLNLQSASSPDTMRGEGQEYTDVYPPPPLPIVPVLATRVECAQSASESSGV